MAHTADPRSDRAPWVLTSGSWYERPKSAALRSRLMIRWEEQQTGEWHGYNGDLIVANGEAGPSRRHWRENTKKARESYCGPKNGSPTPRITPADCAAISTRTNGSEHVADR